MPAGLDITNDSGTYSVSSNIRNPVLVGKSTVTSTSPGTAMLNSQFSISYDTAGLAPIIGIIPSASYDTALWTMTSSGTTYTYVYVTTAPVGTVFQYYIFDNQPAPTDNFGLELYDEFSRRIYHTQYNPLRIRHAYVGNGSTVTFESGRTYAVAIGRHPYNRTVTYIPQTDRYNASVRIGVVRAVTNGIQSSMIVRQNTPNLITNPGELQSTTAYILVLDVTGY